MDSIVKVRRSFLNRIRGLLVAFRSPCNTCYKGYCDCFFATEMARAKGIIFEIDNIRDADEEKFFVENPQLEKFACIVKAIEQAGRPVLACEIDAKLDGEYKRQKKHQLLATMLRRGMIRTFISNNQRFYTIPGVGDGNNKNNKGEERHGV